MKPAAVSLWVSVAAVALGVGQFVVGYGRLPERVALHFDAAGLPDRWGSRGEFVAVSVGVYLLVVALLLPWGYVLQRVPAAFINLPNKAHWLAPERRDGTIAELRRSFATFVAGTLVFLALVFHLVLRANLKAPPALEAPAFWSLTGVYTVGALLWSFGLWRRFAQVADPSA